MPWNGAGVYSPPVGSFPEVNGTIIDAVRFDATINDLATGITAALAKNGENLPTANLPMSGFKHTGAGDGAAAGQYVAFAQATNAYVSGRWGVGGTPSTDFHLQRTASSATARIESITSGTASLEIRAATGAGAYAPQVIFYNVNTALWALGGGNIGSAGATEFSIYGYNAARNVFTITTAGAIQDGQGNELGFKDLPFGAGKAAPYTILSTDRGSAIVMNTASNVTIPTGLPQFAVVVIYNNSGSALTLVQGGGATLRLDGTASTGNRILAANGKAVLWCFNPPTYSIGGAGVS